MQNNNSEGSRMLNRAAGAQSRKQDFLWGSNQGKYFRLVLFIQNITKGQERQHARGFGSRIDLSHLDGLDDQASKFSTVAFLLVVWQAQRATDCGLIKHGVSEKLPV